MVYFRLIANDDTSDGQRRYMGLTKDFEILWVLDPKEAILLTEERAKQAIEDALKLDKRNRFVPVPAIVAMATE